MLMDPATPPLPAFPVIIDTPPELPDLAPAWASPAAPELMTTGPLEPPCTDRAVLAMPGPDAMETAPLKPEPEPEPSSTEPPRPDESVAVAEPEDRSREPPVWDPLPAVASIDPPVALTDLPSAEPAAMRTGDPPAAPAESPALMRTPPAA